MQCTAEVNRNELFLQVFDHKYWIGWKFDLKMAQDEKLRDHQNDYILWGTWMSVPCFVPIHSVNVEIFHWISENCWSGWFSLCESGFISANFHNNPSKLCRYLTQNQVRQPHGGATGTIRGWPKSVILTFWGPWKFCVNSSNFWQDVSNGTGDCLGIMHKCSQVGKWKAFLFFMSCITCGV